MLSAADVIPAPAKSHLAVFRLPVDDQLEPFLVSVRALSAVVYPPKHMATVELPTAANLVLAVQLFVVLQVGVKLTVSVRVKVEGLFVNSFIGLAVIDRADAEATGHSVLDLVMALSLSSWRPTYGGIHI
jgi:hypothetical protein